MGVRTSPEPWTMLPPSMGPLSLEPSPLRGIVIDLEGCLVLECDEEVQLQYEIV